MSELVNQVMASCQWDTTNFLVISGNVFDPFIYYSHVVPLATSLLIGCFIYFKNRKLLVNQILFILTILFSIWVFFDLILWATDRPALTMFFWSFINLIEPFIYFFSLYFVQVFISGKDTSLKNKLAYSLPLIPLILLAFTNLNLVGFNLSNCDREAIEGPLAHYIYLIEVFYVICIALYTLNQLAFKSTEKKQQIILITGSILCFLMAFSWGNIVGSLTESWRVSQWGLFGMPIFIGVLAYLIIKYNAFNIKIISTQIFITSFPILVGSQFFLTKSFGNKVITVITFTLSLVAGLFLARSVKKEVESREKIEKLAIDLEIANSKLKELDQLKSEFLSFASHQLRNPLTAVKGYASLVLEGDYGKVKPEITGVFQTIYDSTVSLLLMVQDFLDVTKITQGGMKYDMQEFDIRKLLEDIIIQEKPVIDEKGLTFDLSVLNENENYTILGDTNKLKQVFVNVIDNSIKYTPKGRLKLILEKQATKYIISVKDTGVGISQEDIAKLFEKFSRATGAKKINVTGSGLGLYLAKQIVEAHKGSVRVESPGVGLGSTFIIELPVL
jgi:signal transduction histidine kinase